MSDSPKSVFARIAGWFSRAEAPGISEGFCDPDRTNKDALVQFLPYVTKDLKTLDPDLLPHLRRYTSSFEDERLLILLASADDFPDCAKALEKAARVYQNAAQNQAGAYFPQKQQACLYLAAMLSAKRIDEPVSSGAVSRLLDVLVKAPL